MKYIVILADGMAGRPLAELDGKTTLQTAAKPNMDYIAQNGVCGMTLMVPVGMPPQSDTANLCVMGYDPKVYYRGRSPLEAVSLGIEMGPTDAAYRCNIVTLSDEPCYDDKSMIDYSSDEIPTEEAEELIKTLQAEFNSGDVQLYPGKSYRHCLILRNANTGASLTPPHDITGRPIRDCLPKGEHSVLLEDIMRRSYEILKDHPINLARIARGERPANSCWFWGEGTKPALTPYKELYGQDGGVVCGVDLIKGLGICAGMAAPEIPGATGAKRTDFAAKGRAAVDMLRDGKDMIYVHIEAPDESGHAGDIQCKIDAIEAIDSEVIAPIMAAMREDKEPFGIMVLPDHPTPIEIRTHSSDPVPFAVYYEGCEYGPHGKAFTEEAAENTGFYIEQGHTLMGRFINKDF